ncbi:MAG: hypothetical protein GWP19_06945 [Planctomycetia bacterium]|nr:hypothetical protein [Planctomycetia bacterium]
MNSKVLLYRTIKLFIFILTFILILSSCDIIDEIMGGGDNSDLTAQQEQALTTVLTLQDDASDILDNLFIAGMDTFLVIDSLASFFLSDTSIQDVWPDSDGVAVEYKNGISGGIFVGRFNPPTISGSPPDTSIIGLPDDDLQKPLSNNNSLSPKIKKSIYFDGAYPQFKVSADKIIEAANKGFTKVGIAPFVKYQGSKATLDVLSTLDQYGIIHISGHGWYRRVLVGSKAKRITYLLTGEVADLNTINGDIWQEILDKNIIVAKHNGENRYWVGPKYISDRNNFHDNKVFVCNGFCYGLTRAWRVEIVKNAGASVLIGYKVRVPSTWDEKWAIKMYTIMCDTELNMPKTIRDCLNEIYKGIGGYTYYLDGIVHLNYAYTAGAGYTFWENELLNGSVRFFLDTAVFGRSTDPIPITANLEEVLYLNDANGSFSNNVFNGNYSYQSLGRTFSGNVKITFIDNPESIDVYLDNKMSYEASLGYGTRVFEYTVGYSGIPFEGVDSNSGKYIYSESGSSVSKINVTWRETNSLYIETLTSYTCGTDAYIKVAVDKRE